MAWGNWFKEEMQLLFHPNTPVIETLWQALQVASTSLAITVFVGLPLGGLLAVRRFSGKEKAIKSINRFRSVPIFIVTVMLLLLVAKAGSASVIELLYNAEVLITVQSLFLIPVMVAQSHQYIETEWRRLQPQLRSWRMNRRQALPTLFWGVKIQVSLTVIWLLSLAVMQIAAFLIFGSILGLTNSQQYGIEVATGEAGAQPVTLVLGSLLLLFAAVVRVLIYLGGKGLKHHR